MMNETIISGSPNQKKNLIIEHCQLVSCDKKVLSINKDAKCWNLSVVCRSCKSDFFFLEK